MLSGFLRRALSEKDPGYVLSFEKFFIKVGLPSFFLTVVTGVAMGLFRAPPALWLSLGEPVGRLGVKAILVVGLVALMVYAERRVLPALRNDPRALPKFTVLATAATTISVILVIVGWMLRFGI